MSCETNRTCGTGKCDHLKGVCCDVKNCVHHDGETHCTAKEITVGPTYAASSCDTACATFKPHETCGGGGCNL